MFLVLACYQETEAAETAVKAVPTPSAYPCPFLTGESIIPGSQCKTTANLKYAVNYD